MMAAPKKPVEERHVVRNISMHPRVWKLAEELSGSVPVSRWISDLIEAVPGASNRPVPSTSIEMDAKVVEAVRSHAVERPSDEELIAMATGVSVAAQEALEAHRSDPVEFVAPPPIEPTSPVSPRDLERHLATPDPEGQLANPKASRPRRGGP